MRRLVLISMLALAGMSTAHAASTLRVGSQVLATGESAARAIQLLGQPSYKEPIESKEGGHVGERWQFQRGDSTVTTVTIIDGKVAAIEERRN